MKQNAYRYASLLKSKILLRLSTSAKRYVSMETVVQATRLRTSQQKPKAYVIWSLLLRLVCESILKGNSFGRANPWDQVSAPRDDGQIWLFFQIGFGWDDKFKLKYDAALFKWCSCAALIEIKFSILLMARIRRLSVSRENYSRQLNYFKINVPCLRLL